MTKTPCVHVIIPVYDNMEDTLRCVHSIREQRHRKIRIIIVDCGPSDTIGTALRRRWKDVVVLRHPGRWWTEAMRIGVDHVLRQSTDGDFILSFNNDLVFNDKQHITALVRLSEENHRALVGSVSVRDGEEEASGGWYDWKHCRMFNQKAVPGNHPLHVQFAYGRGLLIPVEVCDVINYDGKTFPQYRGDTDFACRATAAGMTILLCRTPTITHPHAPRMVRIDGMFRTYAQAWTLLTQRESLYSIAGRFMFIDRHCPANNRFGNKCAILFDSLYNTIGQTFPFRIGMLAYALYRKRLLRPKA